MPENHTQIDFENPSVDTGGANGRDPLPSSAEGRLAALVGACGGPVRQVGSETVCRCPAHDDANPSLNVRLGDLDHLLVKCRAGCETSAILAAIGWEMSDLMTRRDGSDSSSRRKQKKVYEDLKAIAAAAGRVKKGKVESTHVYKDSDDRPVFAVIRVRCQGGEKEIPQVRPEGGGWVFGGIKKQRPLYGLPGLLAAPGDPVLLFEGEQKADLACALGFTATSCSQGAGNAKLTDFSHLHGRDILLFPDNDTAGSKHMQDVAARCGEVGARSVSLVDLPDLPEKGDIVNFHGAQRAAGATDDEIADTLRTLIAAAVEVDPGGQPDQAVREPGADDSSASIADQLVNLASDAELFHDGGDEPYAAIQVGEHREIWRVNAPRFQRWLSAKYFRTFGRAVPPASMATAVGQLSAMAMFDGESHPVHMRVAKVGGDLWIDLCNDKWSAVRVTAGGWKVDDAPSTRFVRKPGMKALPFPEQGSVALDELFELLHIDNADERLLVLAWLVNCLMESTSYPILALSGEQGSGKTTFSRALQRLVDPHEMEGRSPPRGEEDIAVAAQHAHLLVYENLSGLSQQMSDALCRVATGAGFAARKLYTDADERQLRFCRPMIINGIDELATRSDLADRVISITLPRIPPERRQTEVELWQAFDEMQPRLFGGLLELMVRVLAISPVETRLERMAEYSRLGGKVAIALGLDPMAFADAYRANRDESALTAVESSPVGAVVRRLVRAAPYYGLVGGLLHELQQKARQGEQQQSGWPRSAKGLGGELRRLAPCLARLGVEIEFLGHRRDGHWVSIKEVGPEDGHNGHNGHEEAQDQWGE